MVPQLLVRDVEVLQRVKLDVTKDMHTFNPMGLLEVKERRAAKRARTARPSQSDATSATTGPAAPVVFRPRIEPLPAALVGPADAVARRGWLTTEGYWATCWGVT